MTLDLWNMIEDLTVSAVSVIITVHLLLLKLLSLKLFEKKTYLNFFKNCCSNLDFLTKLLFFQRIWFTHFGCRFVCLVLVPMSLYIFQFYILVTVLSNSGPQDEMMSSAFQASLKVAYIFTKLHIYLQSIYIYKVFIYLYILKSCIIFKQTEVNS